MLQFHTVEERARRIFEEGFTAMDVAVHLRSFDRETPAPVVRQLMQTHDFDVVGVRVQGLVEGYVSRESLDEGACGDHFHAFEEDDILQADAPLSKVVLHFRRKPRAFVRVLGAVGGIVTVSDMQKPCVRMWLFGVITMMEMNMNRLIEARYPGGRWKALVPEKRLEKAVEFWKERKRRNQETDLLACLQFSDKGQLLMKDPEIRRRLEISSRRQGEERVKMLESLRNNLAHAQDIITYDGETIVRLAENLGRTLRNFTRFPAVFER